MSPKFKKVFDQMLADNQEIFIKFKLINDAYEKDQKKFSKQFQELGSEVMVIIKKYEDILCGTSEKGGFGTVTQKLTDKLWGELRKNYSMIDDVGVETE